LILQGLPRSLPAQELPPRLLLYTIEGERFGYSGQLTDSVASGVRAAVTAIQEICA